MTGCYGSWYLDYRITVRASSTTSQPELVMQEGDESALVEQEEMLADHEGGEQPEQQAVEVEVLKEVREEAEQEIKEVMCMCILI